MKTQGKRIQARMQKTFGIDTDFLIKCCQGDEVAMKQLGQMGIEGELISRTMPRIKEAALATIKGTEDLNTGIATIIKQAASSTIAIDRSQAEVMLANQKYGNDRKEIAASFATAKQSEQLRHSQTIDYIKLNAWIDQSMMRVDGNFRLLEATNKPELRQLDVNIAHKQKLGEHYLKYGDASRADLLPKREYGGITGGLAKLKQAILGF